MPNLLTVLLVNSDSSSRTAITALLARCRRPVELSATTGSLQEAMKHIESETPPQVVILEAHSIAQGVRDVSTIRAINPQTMIMVTSEEKHPDWILTLIRAGAGEYLTTPIILDELEDALERAAGMFERRVGVEDVRGKVITVFNPSGGMGTTTIAVNLAATLAAKGEMTALLDLNPFSSDISAFLDLNAAYTLSSIQGAEGRIDASFLTGIMTRHSSGIKVLCGAEEVGVTTGITPNQILNLLTLIRGQFGVTVIDTGGSLSERVLETFNGSDLILYPLTLTLPALNNARRYLKSLNYHGFGPERVKVLVNRYLPKDDIRLNDAEKILGVNIFHTIPNSYVEIKESIYKGTPLVTCFPRSLVTKALTDLAGHVMTELSGGSR
jgi:pilus assembly protein CpaE